ncbi:MAG: hypothetical protein Kow0027_16570 [Saprospiraceae bacterium]
MEPIIYRLFNYTITDDPDELDNGENYSPEIEYLLRNAYRKLKEGKIRKAGYLKKLVEKYPHIPAFQNYLVVYYMQKGLVEEAYQVNHRIIEEHPDYLFGKINLAGEYLNKGKPEEVPKILGQALDLKDLYPERKVFHVSEFRALFGVAVNYFLATDNFEAIEGRMDMAEKVLGKDDELLRNLKWQILLKRMERGDESISEPTDMQGYKKIIREYDKTVQTGEPPTFHHEEIWQLYQHGLKIDHSILKRILELPRGTLVEDLETVLLDSLRRYEHFRNKLKADDCNEEELYFPLHALFLLTELRATESLPAILEHLRQGGELLDFWHEDHLFETLWHFIFHLGKEQLDLFKAFVLERNISYEGKSVISQAVLQIALHYPERKSEIVHWYEDILDTFLDNIEDAGLIDIDFISNLLSDVADLSASHLLPKIKQFYELDLVDEFYTGSYESLEKGVLNAEADFMKNEVFENIFDHYLNITTTWYGYMPEEQKKGRGAILQKALGVFQKKKQREKESAPPTKLWTESQGTMKREMPKVGRNDPCPCGSGKKYKKCCFGK